MHLNDLKQKSPKDLLTEAEALGIEDGYIQQKESSDQGFIPVFDGTGVERAAERNTKK